MAIIAGLDIETTGLLSPDHRIVEVYISMWKGRKRVWELNQRIDPERSISADSQRIHGISASDLVGAPKWSTVAPTVHAALSRADVFVAHNGDEFDLPFLDQELKRVGLALPQRPSIDTMQSGTWATHDGKKPRLSELCFACGIAYDPAKAHAADYDVGVMMDAFYRGLDWGFFDMPQAESVQSAA